MEILDSLTGKIEKDDEKGAWHWLAVPSDLNELIKNLPQGHFGFVPITAKLSSSQWDTSFLPAGDGSYFLTIPAKVRKAQEISLGDTVTIEFAPRQ